MRTIFLGFFVFAMWATFARYYYVCEIKNHCGDVSIFQRPTPKKSTKSTKGITQKPKKEYPVVTNRSNTLNLMYNGKVVDGKNQEFHFDSGKVAPVLSKSNNVFLERVAKKVFGDPNNLMTITGYYRPSEKDMTSGIYENLGTARAAAIRDILVEMGVDENRISLDAEKGNTEDLKSPIGFEIFKKKKDKVEGATASEFTPKGGTTKTESKPKEYTKVKFTFHDMTFSDANFEYNSDVFIPNKAFKLYADSLKTYFDVNPGKTLNIIGHTDAIGSDDYNDDLGLRRAQSVRKYLKELNVKGEILTDSKGRRYPMATNDEEVGRKKNRRVNFVIE